MPERGIAAGHESAAKEGFLGTEQALCLFRFKFILGLSEGLCKCKVMALEERSGIKMSLVRVRPAATFIFRRSVMLMVPSPLTATRQWSLSCTRFIRAHHLLQS